MRLRKLKSLFSTSFQWQICLPGHRDGHTTQPESVIECLTHSHKWPLGMDIFMQEQAKRSLLHCLAEAEWMWLQPPIMSPMKRGERKHARGAGLASPLEFPRWSPLLSCISSSESMNHPHLPAVNLSCLISLELIFCYFQWKESCLVLCGSCQALPAFGICPCSSSSLDCSLQKFHDSFALLLQVGLKGHLLSEASPGHFLWTMLTLYHTSLIKTDCIMHFTEWLFDHLSTHPKCR